MDKPNPPKAPKANKPTKKDWNGKGKAPSNLIHIRLSYLYQAANHIATQQCSTETTNPSCKPQKESPSQENAKQAFQATSRRLLTGLRHVALKQNIRISHELKHSICRSCDSLLIEGKTCTSEMENKSKGGKKEWADVLVRRCDACGKEKRFPLGERQRRRRDRPVKATVEAQVKEIEMDVS